MALKVDIPGRGPLELEHVLLDQNGTLSDRGTAIDGVAERLARVAQRLRVHVLSADTFGTLDSFARVLAIDAHRVASGDEKLAFMSTLGPERCAAIGNGNNDMAMLSAAGLALAVIGPEGASVTALSAADIVCRSILDALDLLLDERLLIATLRA